MDFISSVPLFVSNCCSNFSRSCNFFEDPRWFLCRQELTIVSVVNVWCQVLVAAAPAAGTSALYRLQSFRNPWRTGCNVGSCILEPAKHINSSSIEYSYHGLGQMTIANSTQVLAEVISWIHVSSVLQHKKANLIQAWTINPTHSPYSYNNSQIIAACIILLSLECSAINWGATWIKK